jgi:basic membrane protein A
MPRKVAPCCAHPRSVFPASRRCGLALTLAAGSFFVTLPALAADGFTLKDKPKIAMIYFGPKNDGGWTQAFDEAR